MGSTNCEQNHPAIALKYIATPIFPHGIWAALKAATPGRLTERNPRPQRPPHRGAHLEALNLIDQRSYLVWATKIPFQSSGGGFILN